MRSRNGFTLIEILVVIAVISTLAALVAPNVMRHLGRARHSAARSQVEMLATALESYRLDIGRYPATADGLTALRDRPVTEPDASRWLGPYLRKDVPDDPWGNPYQYRYPGERQETTYELWSFGADGVAGGEGDAVDVTSW